MKLPLVTRPPFRNGMMRWTTVLGCAAAIVATTWWFDGVSPFRRGYAADAADGKAAERGGDRDAGGADEPAEQNAEPDDDSGEGGIGFPSDRSRERQLDRARRLAADERWSDAATLLDEILAADSDFFFRPQPQQRTWQSIKSEATRLVGGLGRPGREAYELQFRARAERLLDEAVSAGDFDGIVAVARRWFHTPAGYRATMMAAIESLEANEPLAAAAWLDRLAGVEAAAAYEPTLSVMRAVAWWRSGESSEAAAILERARALGGAPVRIAGKNLTLSFPPGGGLAWLEDLLGDRRGRPGHHRGDWVMHRGNATRNGIVSASAPLLAPRYRVPLARHPEEARLLEARRRHAADQEQPLLPAAVPLAVDGVILVHTPLGLLAVDFDSGKRIWLQTGSGAVPQVASRPGSEVDAGESVEAGSATTVFEDATSGLLASDGRCVFVVEGRAEPPSATGMGARFAFPGGRGAARDDRGGNVLAAYAIKERGTVRWRVAARDDAPKAEGRDVVRPRGYFLGPPLPVGEQLLVLVEHRGEVSLDVLSAATGKLEWSQPLAEIDEDRVIDNESGDGRLRRFAGLSPAFAEGVLVCPTGAGAVVAVDLATRTLLWAQEYPQTRQTGVIVRPNGIQVPRANLGIGFGGDAAAEERTGRWLDAAPILAGGRVLVTPQESQELLCLDLRKGGTLWRAPRKERLYVAGIVDDRAIVVGRRGVEAVDMASGKVVWRRPFAADSGSPSGRGIVTADRLFLPLDTPEVLEFELAEGRIVGRASARGTHVPGNLVAYRGEVISQSVDSLDVFHQTAPLESRIETVLTTRPQDPWAVLWRGQLALERGDIAAGLARVRSAHELEPNRVSAAVVADAVAFALRRDFARAAPFWREAVALSGSEPEAVAALRAAVDGFVALGDTGQAWEALRQLLERATKAADTSAAAIAGEGLAGPTAEDLVADGSDRRLAMAPARWLEGRLADVRDRGAPAVREAVDAFVAAQAAAVDRAPPSERLARQRLFISWYGRHPAGVEGRRKLAGLLPDSMASAHADDDGRSLVAERDLVLLEMRQVGEAADRETVAAAIAAIEQGGAGTTPVNLDGIEAAWPVGRIAARRGGGVRVTARVGGGDAGDGADLRFLQSRLMHVPVQAGADSLLPGLELAYDRHQQMGMMAIDGFGRTIGEGFEKQTRADAARMVPILGLGPLEEATVVGRVVFVRSAGSVAAFDLSGRAEPGVKAKLRMLWSAPDRASTPRDAAGMAFVVPVAGDRMPRQGNRPLGARVFEPRGGDPPGASSAAWGLARVTGLPVMVDRTLRLHDPLTGRVLWERQRLPAAGEIFGDNVFLCVCPADGRGAVVLSMADGRIVRTLDLPAAERRLAVSGRRVVVIEPRTDPPAQGPLADAPGRDFAARVALELLDPVDGSRVPLGEFHGQARGTSAGEGRLAVVEPAGELTLLDLEGGKVVFRTRLSDMPAGFEQLQVLSWADRYLVFVGRAETADEQRQLERIGRITTLPAMPGRPMPQLVTGSLWAVDRSTGDSLWPVPVTILRHSLLAQSGSQLPVLLFARAIESSREPERQRLSVLCIDKRTGQAVYVDDRFNARSAARPDMMVLGCSLLGDPATHTISLSQGRREMPDLQLEFTGGPTAPRPPYQATARAASADPLGDIEFWIKKALSLPLPF